MLLKVMVHQDMISLLALTLGVFPCVFYVVIYGISTSKLAFYFGDPTPKLNGGFSKNPLLQVEPVGLLFFVTTGLGWGKWFPVRHGNLKRPVVDLLKIHGGGMLAVMVTAMIFLFFASCLYDFASDAILLTYFVWFFTYAGVLGVGFSLFQVLPLPFFGGFRMVYLLLSQPMQKKLEKYANVMTMVFLVCLWSGIFEKPLGLIVSFVLSPLCQLVGLPFSVVEYYFL